MSPPDGEPGNVKDSGLVSGTPTDHGFSEFTGKSVTLKLIAEKPVLAPPQPAPPSRLHIALDKFGKSCEGDSLSTWNSVKPLTLFQLPELSATGVKTATNSVSGVGLYVLPYT